MSETATKKPRRNDVLGVRVGPSNKVVFLAKVQAKGLTPSQAIREALLDWMRKP